MKKTAIFLILVMAASVQLYAVWTDVDKAGQERLIVYDDLDSLMPQISCAPSGDPFIAWYVQNQDGSTDVHLLKWGGNGWTDIDGSGTDESCVTCALPGNAMYPKVEVDASGYAHLAWEQWIPGYSNEIYYTRWDGTQWVKADGTPGFDNVSQTPLQSSIPSIEVGSDLRARITWHEGSDEFNKPETAEICFLQYTGTAWADADGTGRESMNISQTPSWPSLFPSIALDGAGRPVITWSDGTETNREIYLLRFNGSVWTDASGNPARTGINISNTAGYSSWPDIETDASGNPHVVWEDFTTGYQDIYYLKWNGLSWVDVDGSGTDRMNVSDEYHLSSVPKIKIDTAGSPHILFGFGTTETNERYCIKWSSVLNDWTGEGGYGTENITSNDINDSWSAFDLDESGYPVAIWNAGRYTEQHSVRLLRWQPDGTPTVTPTISPTHTIDVNATITKTFTITRTVTPTKTMTITKTCTHTMTINPQPSATPNICWSDADGAGRDTKKVSRGTQSDMALDNAGNPMLAYMDSGDIYFSKWNGGWSGAAGVSGGDRISYMVDNGFSPSIASGAAGRPCVVWAGGLTIGWQNLFYLEWNGSAWVDADGTGVESISIPYHSIYDSRHPEEPSLSVIENGGINYPGVAWSDYYAGMTWTVRDIIYVQRPSGVWCDIDGTGFDKSRVSDNLYECHSPSVCQLSAAALSPFIAWIAEAPGGGIVQVKKEQSGAWVNMDGSIGPAASVITNPFIYDADDVKAIRCPADSMPAVVFTAMAGGTRQVCYLKWNGSEWVDIDGTGQESANVSMTSGNAYGPSVDFDAACLPHISWYDTLGIHFIKWNGGSFVDASGNLLPRTLDASRPGSGKSTAVKILPSGQPAVSWFDDIAGQDDVYYLQFTCQFNTPTSTATISPTITQTSQLSPTPTVTATPTGTQRPTELKIIKKATGENPRPGSMIEYIITIENNDNIPACCLNVWDTLPENISYDSALGIPAPVLSGRLLMWNLGNAVIAPGDRAIISFRARVDYLRSDSLIINRASCDWHDGYYISVTHPAVDSEVSYFPEGTVRVYPNPFGFTGNENNTVKFINVVPGSTVKIYTVSGELVNAILAADVMVKWNLKNRYAKKVSPGIYYYVVENPESEKRETGKIFILNQEVK